MPQEDEFWPGQPRLRRWGTWPFRFWPRAALLLWPKCAPSSIAHSPRKLSSRWRLTNGRSTRNGSNNIAGASMPEVRETVHLKDLWNNVKAQAMAGDQLA